MHAGAMRALCDTTQFREMVCKWQYTGPEVGQLFESLLQLINLLILQPSNIPTFLTSEQVVCSSTDLYSYICNHLVYSYLDFRLF